MKSNSNILFMSSLVLAMVYFAHRCVPTKILCIWFLAFFPMFPGSRAKFNLISYGLLLSSVGDISLEMGRDGPYFICKYDNCTASSLFYDLPLFTQVVYYFFLRHMFVISFIL